MPFRIGTYSGSLAAIGASGDRSVTVTSSADFPGDGSPWNPGDTARVSIEHPVTHEIVRRLVTAVNGNVFSLDEALGATFPVGSLVELRNDPATLNEFVSDRAAQADTSSQAAIQTEIRSQVKPSAQVGGGRYPLSDVGGGDQLDSEDHDSVDQGRSIPLIDGAGNVVERISVYETKEYVKDDIETQLVPEGGTTDQVLAKRSDTNFDLKWKDDAEGSGGGNVPENRQIPAGGSTDQVLAKSSNTDYAVKWKDDEGQTADQVDAKIAARVPDGGKSGEVLKKKSDTDGDTEWARDETNPATIPTGASFPSNPEPGDRFRLTHGDSQIDDHVVEVVQAQTTLRQLHLGGGSNQPNYLRSYATTYTGPSQASLRGKTFVVYSGSGSSNPPNRLHFYAPGATRVTYAVSNTPVGGGFLASYYEVTGLTYALFTVGPHETNIQYSDGTRFFVDAPSDIGDYTYTGLRWDYTPGVAASWAVQGEAEPQGSDDQTAAEVSVDTTNFGNNLTTGADTAQKAFDELDNLNLGAGGGGLNSGQVRDQVKAQIQAGPGINVESDGADATQTLEISATENDSGVDVLATDSARARQTASSPSFWRLAGLSSTNRFAFTHEGTAYGITSIEQHKTDNTVSVTVQPVASRSNLDGVDIDINGVRFPFSRATEYEPGDASNPDEYSWRHGAQVFTATNNVAKIISPIGADNYVPGAGPNDDVLKRVNNANAWGKVDTANVDDNAITAGKLATDAVETAKIKDGAVTASKLASGAALPTASNDTVATYRNNVWTAEKVNSALIADGAIQTIDIAEEAVTRAKIASGAVGTDEIEDNTVSEAKIADAVTDRLVPAGGTDGQFLSRTGTGYEWDDAPSGGGGTGTGEPPDLLHLTVSDTTKTVTASSTEVVLSDWSAVTLADKATATEGVTVANNQVTFAHARKCEIKIEFYATVTDGGGSDGTRRAYGFVKCVKIGTPNSDVKQSSDFRYAKMTEESGVLAQGPDEFYINSNFSLDAEAGDVYEIQVKGYLQNVTALQIKGADSDISIRFDRFSGVAANDQPAGATTFTALTDTPGTYGTRAGQTLLVNSTNTALVFGQLGTGAIADDAITPAKLQADSAAQQKAMRERIGVDGAFTLPISTEYNQRVENPKVLLEGLTAPQEQDRTENWANAGNQQIAAARFFTITLPAGREVRWHPDTYGSGQTATDYRGKLALVLQNDVAGATIPDLIVNSVAYPLTRITARTYVSARPAAGEVAKLPTLTTLATRPRATVNIRNNDGSFVYMSAAAADAHYIDPEDLLPLTGVYQFAQQPATTAADLGKARKQVEIFTPATGVWQEVDFSTIPHRTSNYRPREFFLDPDVRMLYYNPDDVRASLRSVLEIRMKRSAYDHHAPTKLFIRLPSPSIQTQSYDLAWNAGTFYAVARVTIPQTDANYRPAAQTLGFNFEVGRANNWYWNDPESSYRRYIAPGDDFRSVEVWSAAQSLFTDLNGQGGARLWSNWVTETSFPGSFLDLASLPDGCLMRIGVQPSDIPRGIVWTPAFGVDQLLSLAELSGSNPARVPLYAIAGDVVNYPTGSSAGNCIQGNVNGRDYWWFGWRTSGSKKIMLFDTDHRDRYTGTAARLQVRVNRGGY